MSSLLSSRLARLVAVLAEPLLAVVPDEVGFLAAAVVPVVAGLLAGLLAELLLATGAAGFGAAVRVSFFTEAVFDAELLLLGTGVPPPK
jgi:hypothetical protein